MTIHTFLSKAWLYLTDEKKRFLINAYLGLYNKMPDDEYLKKMFSIRMGKSLDLENPQTFNEKIQWLKLYDRNPGYTTMVDKYAVKEYVANKIGEQYIIPTLGVWDKFDDIDFTTLPNQFVLKCTHDSGGIAICEDKKTFDMDVARRQICKSLKRNFFYSGREWPYKNVKPRIIAEKYMTDESGIELKDYKVFNFNGEPRIVQVDFDRFKQHKRNLYTTDWKYIEEAIEYPTDPNRRIPRPQNLEKMLEMARILSEGIPHVRTDFYSIEDQIYFGELTFYHESGFGKFSSDAFALQMGKWIKLPGGGVFDKKR